MSASAKAKRLGESASFRGAQPISARRQAMQDAGLSVTRAEGDGPPTRLRLEQISANPDNPREDLGDISAMADTLQAVGQVLAITVATVEAYLQSRPERAGQLKVGAEYVAVDGHRRLAAARLLGWTEIRVMVDDSQVASDERLLEAAFVANTQRTNMSDLEEAAALKKLVGFYGSQSKAAVRLGMTQANISQRLSLLQLSPQLQADLNEGKRTVAQVRGLSRLSPEEQQAKADQRAQEAREAAEAKRNRTRKSSVGSADPTPGYNAVIGAGGGDRATAADVPLPRPPASAAAVDAVDGGSRPEPRVDQSVKALLDPAWKDPESIASLLRQCMTAQDRVLVARLIVDD